MFSVSLGLAETLRRFDEINQNLAKIAAEFREYTQRDSAHGDENFHILHNIILDAVLGRLAVTGLLGKYRYEITLDDIFVLPSLEMGDKRASRQLVSNDENIAELLKPSARMLITGQPGAGKTTWTCWLQSLAMKLTHRRIAVRLRFRDFPDGNFPSYYDLVRMGADPNVRARVKNSQIDAWVTDGRLIFLLDGFDEVSPGHRLNARKWVDGLQRTCVKAPIILTSRPLSTEHLNRLPKLWKRCQMLPFDTPRVENYIARWYRHHPHLAPEQRVVNSHELAAEWQSDPSLKELTGNPLMLGTLLTVHQHEGKSLPRGRAKLYERYIEGMLGPWEQNIPVRRDLSLSEDQKKALLRGIAYHMLLSEVESLSEEDIEGRKGMHSIVREMIEPLQIERPASFAGDLAPLVLSELRERTGMLDGPGNYSFVHKSIAEFLFAQTLNDGHLKTPDGESLDSMWLVSRRLEDRWRGVLYFWSGLTAMKDLQRFITICGDRASVEDVLLELCLLYDQLDRLLKSWLIERVRRVRMAPVPNVVRGQHTIEITAFADRISYQTVIWLPSLPMLTPKGAHSVASELVKVAGLNPEEFADAPVAWQSTILLGIYFGGPPTNHGIPFMKSRLAMLEEKGERGCWVLTAIFSDATSTGEKESCEALRAVLDFRPELKPFAAIIWCGTVRDVLRQYHFHRDLNRNFEAAACFLPALRELEIDGVALTKTSEIGDADDELGSRDFLAPLGSMISRMGVRQPDGPAFLAVEGFFSDLRELRSRRT